MKPQAAQICHCKYATHDSKNYAQSKADAKRLIKCNFLSCESRNFYPLMRYE